MADSLLLEHDGDTATLVINRPEKRNAITEAMWERIPNLAASIDADPSVKVLVIRGSIPAAFCAGADIQEYRERIGDLEWGARSLITVGAALDAIRTMAKPTIAAIRGVCVGGGVGIALGCDLRLADTTATFAIPPARLGLVYPFADTRELVSLVGPSHAKRLLMTARTFGAEEAAAIGFIDQLTEPDDLTDAVAALADEIGTCSQYSVRAMKRTINLIQAGQTEESEETWRLCGEALRGADHAEGIQAFLEKRPPRFTYR
jgi:enoyl-CoA hydratase/carnithine racemase